MLQAGFASNIPKCQRRHKICVGVVLSEAHVEMSVNHEDLDVGTAGVLEVV